MTEEKSDKTLGWGVVQNDGSEMWDDHPVFQGESVGTKERFKLLFYPKKFFLYRYIARALRWAQSEKIVGTGEPFRILDVGCGTGASVVDLKKMFGRDVEVTGVDVVQLQLDLARKRIREYGVHAEFAWFDGAQLPFEDNSVDAIYTSDVLGHVEHPHVWLKELHRVLKPGGSLAMFSESKLGKHAVIRRYLLRNGLNIDPHAEFHISLFSKGDLQDKISKTGFTIEKMLGVFLFNFFAHPDESYEALQGQKKFFFLRVINRLLYWVKKIMHPVSSAWIELCGLIEAAVIGRWVEAQGYVILARKIPEDGDK